MTYLLPKKWLRPHQDDALQSIITDLTSNNEPCFSMATGTGKTRVLVSLPVKCNFKSVIYVFPTLILVDQFKSDYMDTLKAKNVYYICSESRDGYCSAGDSDVSNIFSMPQYIICTTYQSLNEVLNAIPSDEIVDAIIFDEAHHEDAPNCQKTIQTFRHKFNYKISGSATLGEFRDPCFHYTFSDAVRDKICKDYNIHCFIKVDTPSNRKDIIKFLKDVSTQTGNSRFMIFTAFSEADRDGSYSVEKFVREHSSCGLWLKGITAKNSRDERKAIISEFGKQPDGELSLLVSCKTLSEGVDTNQANGVVFIDPTRSPIVIVQRIGRGVRKNNASDSNPASIIVPIYVNPEKYVACDSKEEVDELLKEAMSSSGDFSAIFCILSALQQEDPEMFYNCMHNNRVKKFKKASKKEIVETVKDGESILQALAMKTGDSMDSIRAQLADYEDYTPENISEAFGMNVVVHEYDEGVLTTENIIYSEDDEDVSTLELLKDDDEYDLVADVADVKRYEKQRPVGASGTKKHKRKTTVNMNIDDDFKIMWKLSEDTNLEQDFTSKIEYTIESKLSLEERFERNKELLFKFVEKHGRVPKQSDKVDKDANKVKDGITLGSWFDNQKQKIKKEGISGDTYKQLSTDTIVKAELDRFLADCEKNKDKETLTFEEQLKLLLKFVEKHGNVPKATETVDKDANKVKDGITLGSWFDKQKQKIKKEGISGDTYKQLSTDTIVKAELDRFLADCEKNKDKETLTFEEQLKLLLKFVEKHGNVPKRSDTVDKEANIVKNGINLGSWFNTQKHRNVKKEGISGDTYKQLSTDTIVKAELDRILANKETLTFEEQLELLFKFVEKHGNVPKWSETVDKDANIVKNGINLGSWFNRQKSNVKKEGISGTTYKQLSTDTIVKAELDRYMKIKTIDDSEDTSEEPKELPKEQKKTVIKKPLKIKEITEKKYIAPRKLSELSEYHKIYNGKRSELTQAHFNEDPEDWHYYHELLHKSYAKFSNPLDVPVNRVISKLDTKRHKKQKIIVDMGCGLAEISRYFKASQKYKVISIDYVAADESVTTGNMKSTGLEDESVNYCVFCLSLMGTREDNNDYLKEAKRILDSQGEVIIVEPRDSSRWADGKLEELVKQYFHIDSIQGADEQFLYYYCSAHTLL